MEYKPLLSTIRTYDIIMDEECWIRTTENLPEESMGSRTKRSQPGKADSTDLNSLPPPMRRAYERCQEAEGSGHRPQGDGAHIYARVSSEEQAGPGRTSLDEQIRLSEKALADTGIPVVATWRDEGFSGVSRLCERPVGRELVAALKPGQLVVAYRVDRFSRNALLGLADINELRQRGVGLFIAGDHRWIPPVGGGDLDPFAEFSLSQGIIAAQLDRDVLVSRTQGGKRAQILRGYWPYGVAPYGWRREHDGIAFKLVIDDDEQKALALMQRAHRRGASVPQITAALNEAGFRNRRGVSFEYSAAYAIMRDNDMIKPSAKSGSGAKSTKSKPAGNLTIAAASPAGVSAVVQKKLREAERVQPIIAQLIGQQGCGSYQQLADALNYLGVEAARGGHWHPSSVKNTMAAANVSFANLYSAAAREQKTATQSLPQRPSRAERKTVRRHYQLPANLRGRVQKSLVDILFMRDGGRAAEDIARMLCIRLRAVKAVLKRYPRWDIDDPTLVEQVLARHAAGEDSRKIARALGLELKQVRRVTQIARRRVKPPRKRVPPLAEDREAAILDLRRKGKTGPEIFAELGVDTEPGRAQIRRFLQRCARSEPVLALRHSPVLTDEIAAAKSETKPPVQYLRPNDYHLSQYWSDKWKSALPAEVVLAAELLQQGHPIVEVVSRTGLPRGRVKYIRAALQAGRCGFGADRSVS
jgi:putative DNA-invertase from lambdoid prophage Rac